MGSPTKRFIIRDLFGQASELGFGVEALLPDADLKVFTAINRVFYEDLAIATTGTFPALVSAVMAHRSFTPGLNRV